MINLIKFFSRIKQLIGNRIYALFALVAAVGFVEGLGVTLFFPILQSGFGDDKLSQVLKGAFGFFGLEYSVSLLIGLMALFFILRSIFLIAYARYFGLLSANLLITLRRKILEGVFRADYLYILKKETGYMANTILREITRVVEAFDTFAYVLNYSIFALVYIILSLLVNPQLTVIIMICSPVFIIISRRLNRMVNQVSVDLSDSYGRFHSILIQALSKLKYLKSTFSHERISNIVDTDNKSVGFLGFKLAFLHTLTKYTLESVTILVVVGLLFYHVAIIKKPVNEIIFLSILFVQIGRQFVSAQSSYRRFLGSIGSIETFRRFENELEDNKEDLRLSGVIPDFKGEIRIDRVSVVFPNGKKGLDDVSVRIKPKSVVAFVGHSGSGKSTIANVITGLVKPTSGRIRLGGTDYGDLNLKTLRDNIGYVTQEDVIFSASIKANISLWGEDVDGERLAKVIEMAHIKGFVDDLPDKHESMLGDNGLDISGGQRQRITIARELYKDAKLLIMDEATSSLDSKAERQIYENLEALKGEKTMVVIAHRLSTIKNADYMYVFDEGRVVEEGVYDELSQRRGEFTKMVEEQKLT